MSGFDLGGAVNGAAEWFSNAPIIRGVVNNPVFTALLLTALVAIIAMGLYHYPIKQAGAKKGVRALFYVFFAAAAVMFVHHYSVMRSARDVATRKGIRDVFTGIQQSREMGLGARTPVFPAYGGSPAPAVGGDCGCAAPGAVSAPASPPLHGGAPPARARADNVAPARIALDGVVIEDVVLPTISAQ